MLKPNGRPFQNGDEEQIVALYNKITGRSRTTTQHQWEWLEPPEGKGSMWVIEDKSTNEIIGHHGLIPIRIVYDGKPLLMGKTENTIIHPKLLGNGIYFLYEKKFCTEALNQFDLLITTSGHGAPGKIRKRLNYKPVSKYEIYFTLCSGVNIKNAVTNILKSYKIPKLLLPVITSTTGIFSSCISPFFKSKKTNSDSIKLSYVTSIEQFKEKLDLFWSENCHQFGITIDRSSDYLSWRIFNNPNIEYTFIAAEEKNKLIGYIILKKNEGQFNYGIIEDIVAQNCDLNIYLTLLREAKEFLNKEQCSAIIFPTLKSNQVLSKTFEKAGYKTTKRILKFSKYILRRNIPNDTEFLVNQGKFDLIDSKLYDPAKWYFTGLFFEGIT